MASNKQTHRFATIVETLEGGNEPEGDSLKANQRFFVPSWVSPFLIPWLLDLSPVTCGPILIGSRGVAPSSSEPDLQHITMHVESQWVLRGSSSVASESKVCREIHTRRITCGVGPGPTQSMNFHRLVDIKSPNNEVHPLGSTSTSHPTDFFEATAAMTTTWPFAKSFFTSSIALRFPS